jgi:hypothetical protein
MRRFRLVIATLVAVAMMSIGTAACTPDQQAEAGPVLGQVITLLLDIILAQTVCTPNGGCLPLDPAT